MFTENILTEMYMLDSCFAKSVLMSVDRFSFSLSECIVMSFHGFKKCSSIDLKINHDYIFKTRFKNMLSNTI